MQFYTVGKLRAVHLTGRTRIRAGWRGKIILQVELKHPNPAGVPRGRGSSDPWADGYFLKYRDATFADLQAIGYLKHEVEA